MRYLRIFTAIVFVLSLLFAGWANHHYIRNLNTDYPEITSTVELLEISVQDPPEAMFRELRAQDALDLVFTHYLVSAAVVQAH